VVEPYVARVELGTASIDIDQTYIETVIPKPGHQVMILAGIPSGQVGTLREANMEEGFGVVEVGGESLQVPFNLFSRYDKND
jgi:ribosomal protein S4E